MPQDSLSVRLGGKPDLFRNPQFLNLNAFVICGLIAAVARHHKSRSSTGINSFSQKVYALHTFENKTLELACVEVNSTLPRGENIAVGIDHDAASWVTQPEDLYSMFFRPKDIRILENPKVSPLAFKTMQHDEQNGFTFAEFQIAAAMADQENPLHIKPAAEALGRCLSKKDKCPEEFLNLVRKRQVEVLGRMGEIQQVTKLD